MVGLLDEYDPEAIKKQSLYAGLLGLGPALLAAGQSYLPLQDPQSRARGLMQAGSGFATGQQGYTKDALGNAQTRLATAKAKRDEDQDKLWKATVLGGLMDNPTPDGLLTPGGSGGSPGMQNAGYQTQMPDPSQPIPPGMGTPAASYQPTGMPVADAMGARLSGAGIAPPPSVGGNRFNPQASHPMAQIPAGLRQTLAGLGPEKGGPMLAGILSKQMETTTPIKDGQGQVIGYKQPNGEVKYLPPEILERMGGYAKKTDFQRDAEAIGLKPGTPEYAKFITEAVNRPLAQVNANPNVNMPPQESEFQKTTGKKWGEMYSGLQDSVVKLGEKKGTLDRLESQLSKTYTGPAGEQVNWINRTLKGAGDAAGIDTSVLSGKVAAAEASQALSGQMALELRNPSGGAGMPGAMSDADRKFLQSMVPALGTTPEGRALIFETKRKLLDREGDVAKLARDYRREQKKSGGEFDEGFFDRLTEYSDKHPLFTDQQKKLAKINGASTLRFDANGNPIP